MTETATSDQDRSPVMELIQQIHDHRLDPHNLEADDRQRCVEVLRLEGYTVAEIARVLRHSDRTIKRDLRQIREEHATTPDPGLAERMVGELFQQAEHSMSRLRRLAREAQGAVIERATAERFAWKTYCELIEKLQSVGYLPRVPHSVVAQVYQDLPADPVAGYTQLQADLDELSRVTSDGGPQDPDRVRRLERLAEEVGRAKLAAELTDLADPGDGGDAE